MGAKRLVWHVGFGWHLRRHGPRNFEVREQVVLSEEAWRLDYLLLRKVGEPQGSDEAATLRKLWPLLPQFTIVEYKSPGRPYRRRNLDKVWVYAHAFFADEKSEVARREDLCGVLAIPHRTPSLDEDVAEMGMRWENLGDGYHRVHGGLFVLYVVELDIAGLAEHDDLTYALGSGKVTTLESRRFFSELLGTEEVGMSVQDMEGVDEVMRKLINICPPEIRLEGLEPEQRLAGLEPEQRLAGLDRDHQALALPLEVLRLLPDEYFRSLSPEVQAELRRRLG